MRVLEPKFVVFGNNKLGLHFCTCGCFLYFRGHKEICHGESPGSFKGVGPGPFLGARAFCQGPGSGPFEVLLSFKWPRLSISFLGSPKLRQALKGPCPSPSLGPLKGLGLGPLDAPWAFGGPSPNGS